MIHLLWRQQAPFAISYTHSQYRYTETRILMGKYFAKEFRYYKSIHIISCVLFFVFCFLCVLVSAMTNNMPKEEEEADALRKWQTEIVNQSMAEAIPINQTLGHMMECGS